MDPRGVGKSTPSMQCPSYLRPFSGLPATDNEYEALVAFNRAVADIRCNVDGEIFNHVHAISIARDIEAVRIALGEPQINSVGFSYGTQLAATYAELFPGSIHTMILDGVHDSTVSSLELTMRYHDTYQAAFDRYAVWCNSSFTCLLWGQDQHQILEDALTQAGEHVDCLLVHLASMFLQGQYTALTEGLIRIVLVKTHWLARVFGYLVNKSPWTYRPLNSSQVCTDAIPSTQGMVQSAVRCLDSPPISPNLTAFKQLQHAIDTSAPSMRHMGLWKILAVSCTGWPFPARNPPHRLNITSEIPPVVVVNSLYDFKTPYANAVTIQSQIPGSVLLTTRAGHCSYTRRLGSKASRIMEDYLIMGTLPAPGTTVDR